jgi:hypothetical protein
MSIEEKGFEVLVEFGKGIPLDLQGSALLHLEKELRDAGVPAEVYKHTKPDDSKVRNLMTLEKRNSL